MNVYVCELCGGGGVWGSVECEVAGELGSWLFPFSIITELGVCEATYVCTMHTYIGSCYTCLPPSPPYTSMSSMPPCLHAYSTC